MKKRLGIIALTALVIASVAGCGTSAGNDSTSAGDKSTSESGVETSTPAPTEEQNQKKTFVSQYGYSVNYDDSLFEIITDEGIDCIQLIEQDLEKEVPVYVAIYPSYESVNKTVKGLILQAGIDGLEADETTIGKYDYKSKSVFYETSQDVGILYQTIHVVKAKGSVYVVEIATGEKLDTKVQNEIEEIVASFDAGKLTDKTKTEASTDYSVFTSLPAKQVKAFAEEIKQDFIDRNFESLAKKINYPITIYSTEYKNAKEFQKEDLENVFSSDFILALINTDTDEMFANADGAMFGDGEIWIAEVFDDNGESEGLKIISFNP